MGNRAYNILFHTHTVSGIVISVALYVIFFAGSFSFFRDEFVNWERAHSVSKDDELRADFNGLLENLNDEYPLQGRDIEFRHYYNERHIGVNLGTSKDTTTVKAGAGFIYLDPVTMKQSSYEESYTLGEFLYRLHFFAQIPYPYGYYLSGFVAFFFLFALVTGVLIHWKKIVPNFFQFRPWAKLKVLWTDAHTALGVIGLPFQFVYALTGAFFMLKILLVAPGVYALYDGDEAAFYEALEYSHPSFDYEGKPLNRIADINSLVARTRNMWEDFKVTEIHIFNYGDTGMHLLVSGHLDYSDQFNGPAEVIYRIAGQDIVHRKDPVSDASYLDGAKNTLYRLHLGDYGGYFLRITSFVLGLIGCFVILSGVLIWYTARNKRNIPESQRRFNSGVARWYLAICLGMYPVTAASFILVKAVSSLGLQGIYSFYFLSWALAAALLIRTRHLYLINKYSLLSGSILGLLVPLANGLSTGLWPWVSLSQGALHLAFTDLFWLLLAAIGFWVTGKLKKGKEKGEPSGNGQSDRAQNPKLRKEPALLETTSR